MPITYPESRGLLNLTRLLPIVALTSHDVQLDRAKAHDEPAIPDDLKTHDLPIQRLRAF